MLNSQDNADRIKWSVENFKRLMMLTVTIPEDSSDTSILLSRWHDFTTLLRNYYGFKACRMIRVLQKNPKRGGYHLHVLVDRFLPSHVLLKIADSVGLGRMDFRMVNKGQHSKAVEYVCRYVSRQSRNREGIPKGTRLIGATGVKGRDWYVRVKDCVVENTFSHAAKMLRLCLETSGIYLPLKKPVNIVAAIHSAPRSVLEQWQRLCPGVVVAI